MGMFAPALGAVMGSALSTGALITGGLTLGKVALDAMKPKAPVIPTPEKPPQASKAPERAAIANASAAAAAPGGSGSGNAGTFLTGPSGVDPSTLNLGRNTLLGQ